MKKTLLSIIAITTIASQSFGQIEIYEFNDPTTDYSSGEYEMSAFAVGEQHVDFLVKNSTGTDQPWRITRVRINEINTWADYLCWGAFGALGDCYGVAQMSTNPWSTPFSDTPTIPVGSSGLLKVYVTPDIMPVDTDVTYRYYVGLDETTHMDSVDVKFMWSAGIDENVSEVEFNVSPNPANEKMTITSNQSGNTTITMVDVLGNTVLNEPMSGAKSIDISSFNNGIYFIRVESDGLKPKTRKVVISH